MDGAEGGIGRFGSVLFGRSRDLFEGVVDAFDAVLLHAQQEAARQLRPGRAGIEERRRGVGEEPLRHEVVRLHRALDVPLKI